MRKIIFIGATPPPYHGVTIFNRKMLNSKLCDVFNISHLDTSDHRSLDNLGKFDLLNVLLAVKNFIVLAFRILKLKPDLVYLPISQNIAYLRDGLFILLSKCFSRAKVVIHLHGSYFKQYYDESNWVIRKFIDLTMKKVDTAIVLGDSLKYIFNKWLKNCKVVPNGTDYASDISKKKLGQNRDIIISYLSNLTESKGVLDILEAANIIINRYKIKNIKIKFAGYWRDEKFKAKVFKFIETNQLDNYVIFAGFIIGREKEKFLMGTDIFVFPSWNEGQPLVILEAMAAGCPVIAIKDIGAIPETVIDGETGILVEKQNPEEIAKAIVYLIENPDIRVKMGLAARKRFEENYTIDKNIDNMIKVFKKF
ncbi:D-inositol-3-phosphate glycosyltransferase [subsurface metagenome]